MQSRVHSLAESLTNTFAATLLSWAVMQFVIVPLWQLPMTALDSAGVTAIYTVVSIARNYLVRRIWNRVHVVRMAKAVQV